MDKKQPEGVKPDTAFVFLEIRNDKDRGNLILTITPEELSAVSFFDYQHQPVSRHPEQIQEIVRKAKPTTRTKSIRVDIMPFLSQYYNVAGKFFEFKARKMNSTEQQNSQVRTMRLNKEIGALKRKRTVAELKEQRIIEKNRKIREEMAKDEEKFQQERAERLAAVRNDMQIE